MAAHQLVLTETNSGAFMPLCPCGWVGIVHPVRVTQRTLHGAKKRFPEEAAAEAEAEWASHLESS